MAESKSRLVNTKFWDDKYTCNLDPIEKLLFLYFLTNPLTNIIGIYEIEIRRVAFDTGIDKEMVMKIIDRFTKDDKIGYYDGYIVIKNFIKFQNENSPKVKIGIQNRINELPEVLEKFISGTLKGIDTLTHLTKLKPNLTKPKLKGNGETDSPPVINFIDELIEIFSEEYFDAKGIGYVTQKGKDNKAIGMLLAGYKKKNPESNSDKTKLDFRNLFRAACSISTDKFLSQITIPFLNSQINQYLNYLKNGKPNNTSEFNGTSNKGFDARKNTWIQGIK